MKSRFLTGIILLILAVFLLICPASVPYSSIDATVHAIMTIIGLLLLVVGIIEIETTR